MANVNCIDDAGWNLENSYSRLSESFFTIIKPNPVQSPKLVIFNNSLAESLGFNIQEFKSEKGVAVLGGNELPKGAVGIAQAYAGHQFGHFAMLGDGRALLIGEQVTPAGERFDIQLKGSGLTPYSRGGDGRAALGPMLREYIISEAMHALGIPTTRSLAVVTTGEAIARETYLPGAILTRVASSHLRFGTFQYIAKWCTLHDLKSLADYAIKRHYPAIELDEHRYLSFIQEVIKRHAALVAKWQLVGFIHGVMNTDNMTISGETIDYGPCAFMDDYSPTTVFSSIDVQGRYAYGNQPHIVGWNLARFAETLIPLLDENDSEGIKLAQEAISEYPAVFRLNWLEGMRDKLGIFNEEAADEVLFNELLTIMDNNSSDFTNTFVALSFNKLQGLSLFDTIEFNKWHEKWQARLSRQSETIELSQQLMKASNPAIIPRNHQVEYALESAENKGDYGVLEDLLKVLSDPYAHSADQVKYAKPVQNALPYQTFCGT